MDMEITQEGISLNSAYEIVECELYQEYDEDRIRIDLKGANGEIKTLEIFHIQDCCEHVYCITKDLYNFINEYVTDITKEVYCDEIPSFLAEKDQENAYESFTYTVFTLKNAFKDIGRIIFFGTSNGYYCETADMDWKL